MQGRPAGTPGFMPSQPSSLPTNSSLASLCIQDLADGVRRQRGIQRHRHMAGHPDGEVGHQPVRVFLDQDRDAVAGLHTQALQVRGHAAAWSITSRQVKSRTVPSPCGWVMTTRSGAVFSQ
jgi:hypothetical protein